MIPNISSQNIAIHKWLLIILCFYLGACSNPVNIVKPLHVSRANQIASAQFTVNKPGNYRFAVLFVKGNTQDIIEAQKKTWGNIDETGVPIHLELRILKGNTPVVDEILETTRVDWGQSFYYQDRELNTAVRLIKIQELMPGEYTVSIRTLYDLEAFRPIESLVEFSYYNPKH
ncbi:DUF5625 family protein [Pseudomonas sp. CAM1A]|uniref:DUF5625 family protein n=1 Tax=Pseudomonas sp. CAM1A TaxID=3231717 RepID=UPI0039C64AA8